MYKQIIFMLVGSLILLSQIGISTIVPNAMAIADYYNTDQYMKYAQDMTNKNYDNSHSNSIQKIKCNNINSNLNGIEANIGSDNPLDIGTASLQGDDDSANSYERNNGNFDVDCINNNDNAPINSNGGVGTVGPQGIQGLRGFNGTQGPQGEQGPTGITSINGSNYYSVTGDPDFLGGFVGDNFANSTASCLPGDTAISGEYNITTIATPLNYQISFYGSLGDNPPTNWSTQLQLLSGTGLPGFGFITTTVNCFDNPPLNTLATASSAVSQVRQQSGADSPIIFHGQDSSIISQAIGDSPKVTALEKQPDDLSAMGKITKLKTQWLNQLQ